MVHNPTALTWRWSTWYGGMLVVHHGIKDACGRACYVGDTWQHMVFGNDAWGAPKFEESLHGKMMHGDAWLRNSIK